MALILHPAPPASLDALAKTLPEFAATPALTEHLPGLRAGLQAIVGSKAGAKPELSTPVYILGLDVIRENKDTSALKPVLWTHVLSGKGQRDGSIVSADTAVDSPNVTALSQGAEGGAFWQSFGVIETSPEVARADYELAELRVPALRVDAFLLRGKTPGSELVLPFRSQQTSVQVGKTYPIATFLELLRPAASAVLAEQDEGKGG